MEGRSNYKVGYGKPPKKSQFKKGQSGNPKGRPKASESPDSHLTRELNEMLIITENGRRQRISKGNALIKQVVNKALSGDPGAIRVVFRQVERLQAKIDAVMEPQPVTARTAGDLSDDELMEIILEARDQTQPSSGDLN